jgi:hypothetical protein
MKPEVTAHLGIQDRDLEYEEKCNCSPILFTSLVKRGKSRGNSKNTSTYDGLIKAIEAVSIVEVPNRYLAV